MLSLEGISLKIGEAGDLLLLSDISASFSQGEFVAIIGPSGCGKSTLLKVIAGIATGEENGTIRWNGRDLAKADFNASEIGYVPQFSMAQDELTVAESIEYSARLRVSGLSGNERDALVTKLLAEVGMTEFSERRVKVLSGGQKRRLGLAMELVSSPPILLCDEVTSGLDPQSEDEIVTLLRRVARDGNRLVISVTHSLRHLSDYDSVSVLYQGVLVYSGSPENLAPYFGVSRPEMLYPSLAGRESSEWQLSWKHNSDTFQYDLKRHPLATKPKLWICPRCRTECTEDVLLCMVCGYKTPQTGDLENSSGFAVTPSIFVQFLTLTERRLKIFFRSKSQLCLQVGLVFGFPAIVSIFGWKGLPKIYNLSLGLDVNVFRQQSEALEFLKQASTVGSLISGIIMFEVVLLALMGANNSGREIAGERQIFEKEKLAGLSTGAYLLSKILFLGILCAVQSLWMGFFIHYTCHFPGELGPQFLFLFLGNAAMTSVCLAISSFMGTVEQASLASIYLVGFQLPLSGALLALPSWLGFATRPFIATYWSWSGMLETLHGERYYDIASMVIQTTLSAEYLCMVVLVAHIIAGVGLAYLGCARTRME